RIRNHFPEERIPMDVLDASRSRPDVFSKLYCGYSTPARSGTCCRKVIRTTNPFIGAFKPGAAMKFGSTSLPSTPLGFPARPQSFSRRVAQGARGCSRRVTPPARHRRRRQNGTRPRYDLELMYSLIRFL